MSWIAIDDAVGAILHALLNEDLRGPVNVVAPTPATNQEFTKALGSALSRPTILPMPAFAARLMFGEMADATLLASQRAAPLRLQESGYVFKYPELEGALRHVLK
jgi:NAD dependent epimerase/dehydratase family enzyme